MLNPTAETITRNITAIIVKEAGLKKTWRLSYNSFRIYDKLIPFCRNAQISFLRHGKLSNEALTQGSGGKRGFPKFFCPWDK